LMVAGPSHGCDAPRAVFTAQELILDVQLGGSGRRDGELRFEFLDPLAQASSLGSLLAEGAPQCLDFLVARLRSIDAARPLIKDGRCTVHGGPADARLSI